LASRYIQTKEIRHALERNKAKTARVVPIILEPCQWQLSELTALQVLPKDAKPMKNWRPQRDDWHQVAEELRSLFVRLQQARRISRNSPPS
jgi:hypothetical protein